MVRREISGIRKVSRVSVLICAHVLSLCAAAIVATTCGSSSRTSTGPTPLKCQPSVALSTQSIGAAGGTGTLAVTTQQECAWSVTSAVGWISSLAPASGQGSAQVSFTVASNPEASVRQGDLVLNDQRIAVRQEAAACKYEIAPKSQTLDSGGGEWEVKVTAVIGCAWKAASDAPWMTVKAGAAGTRDGVVVIVADPNGNQDARTGSLTIAGETFAVTQGGSAACTYTLVPATHAAPASGGSSATSVQTSQPSCAWTVSSDSGWLSAGSSSGMGTQTLTFTVAANTGAARTGQLTVGGQILEVNQAAASGPGPGPTCTYSINPTGFNAPAAGVNGSNVAVSAGTGCTWTASTATAWITVTGGGIASGAGTVMFNVAANTGAARNGTITIAGHTFVVTQAAASTPPAPSCSYSINPTSQSVGAAGGNGTIAVTTTAGCGWTAISSATWIVIVSGTSGSGNGSAALTVAPNTGAARSGTVTIAGRIYTVNQTAAPPPPPPTCTYTISPTSQSVSAGGAKNREIDVDTTSSCSWTAVSNAAWITIDSGSSDQGDGTVEYDVASNPGPARQGTITVAGRTFTVNQAGSSYSYSISPSNQSFTVAGGLGSVSVTTQPGWTWTANSNDGWIIVTLGGSGTGNGSVLHTVAPNLGGSRSGTITIAGRTFTVSQN